MAGYTRQDTANNIANGNVIDADDFDAEYNAIESAFNASTGHTHDGTTGGGAPIEKVGPSQDLVVSATDVKAKTTNTLDLGSSTVRFKDAYLEGAIDTNGTLDVSGNATIGGNLTVTGDATINGNLTFGDADTDSVAFGADIDSDLLPEGIDKDIGSSGKQWNDLWIGGTANLSSADISVLDATTADIDGGTIDGTVIGGTTAAAITGTTITGTSLVGPLTGNADTATAWETARSITLTGAVNGTATGVDGSGNISISCSLDADAIAVDSIALGTDTTGSYVQSLVAGTGVTLTNNTGESATPTVAIGQAVETDSDVTFNDLTVAGNLTVSGTTTTASSTNTVISDTLIELGNGTTGTPANDSGIVIERGTADNAFIGYDESADKFTVGTGTFTGSSTGNLSITTGTLVADLEGNADTASALETARTISLTGDVSGSASFDGSANVSITATIADDSHNHVISDIDGLQTEIDTKAELAGSTSQNFSANDLTVADDIIMTAGASDWKFEVGASNELIIYYGTTKLFKLDSSGNLTVKANVTAYGTV